jgi:hypothetical protein
MAARSNSKEDVYEWLWQVITSCENNEQHAVTGKLVYLFKDQYKDSELTNMLIDHRVRMWEKLYNKSKGILLKG